MSSHAGPITLDLDLDGDILREIFIRLPDSPALLHASIACKSWLRAVRDPAFLRRFTALHPPPVVGFAITVREPGGAHAVQLLSRSTTHPGGEISGNIDCSVAVDSSHGLLLIKHGAAELSVHEPLSRRGYSLPPIEGDHRAIGYGLLVDEHDGSSFRVVSVEHDGENKLRSRVFSSTTGSWLLHPSPAVFSSTAVVSSSMARVKDTIYWLLKESDLILSLRTETMEFSTFHPPPALRRMRSRRQLAIMASDHTDGELLVVAAHGFVFQIWRCDRTGGGEATVWVRDGVATIQLGDTAGTLWGGVPAFLERPHLLPRLIRASNGLVFFRILRSVFFLDVAGEGRSVELTPPPAFGRAALRASEFTLPWPPRFSRTLLE